MKLEIRKLGPLRDRLEVVGDHAGLAELRDALGETITIRVVA